MPIATVGERILLKVEGGHLKGGGEYLTVNIYLCGLINLYFTLLYFKINTLSPHTPKSQEDEAVALARAHGHGMSPNGGETDL